MLLQQPAGGSTTRNTFRIRLGQFNKINITSWHGLPLEKPYPETEKQLSAKMTSTKKLEFHCFQSSFFMYLAYCCLFRRFSLLNKASN